MLFFIFFNTILHICHISVSNAYKIAHSFVYLSTLNIRKASPIPIHGSIQGAINKLLHVFISWHIFAYTRLFVKHNMVSVYRYVLLRNCLTKFLGKETHDWHIATVTFAFVLDHRCLIKRITRLDPLILDLGYKVIPWNQVEFIVDTRIIKQESKRTTKGCIYNQ